MARSFDKDPTDRGGPGDGDDGQRRWKYLDLAELEAYGAVGGVDPDAPLDNSNLELLPLPTIEPEPEPEPTELIEDAMEGRHLYIDFVREQIHLERVDQTTHGLMNWTRAGRELRQLADVFSRSREREYVRQRAQTIDIRNLNYQDFFQLLKELFEGEGITRERILVLFFFCADIALESLTRGYRQTFRVLIDWSMRFIGTHVVQWVHEHGGWASVLRNALTISCQVSACAAFACLAISCVVYIKRGGN